MAPLRSIGALSAPTFILVCASMGAGCRSHESAPRTSPAPSSSARAISAPQAARSPGPSPTRAADLERPPRPLERCFPELAVWLDAPVADLLDRAADRLESGNPSGALICAEEASRQAPRSVEAHHDRALALLRLGRAEEARDAVTLALAVAPTDPETLALIADLYVNHLPASADRTAIGLEYAKRGRSYVPTKNTALAARLALLQGQALIDLGRATEAQKALARAHQLEPANAAVRYEQGVALFELCQFDEAAAAFADVLRADPKHAHALYHLGLVYERRGDDERAAKLLAEASARDPKSFPRPPSVSPAEFQSRLRAVVARLPGALRPDLSRVPIDAAEMPALDDLAAEQPPLSPTILGLFRGLPLGREDDAEHAPAVRGLRGGRLSRGAPPAVGPSSGLPAGPVAGVPARAIVLYRRNILRSISQLSELDAAIERTLLHEVGHLRGEDDGSLRDRGLE